ncbi:kinase-like domain-containing protein [Boletus edulis]|uniref:Kinase-like domain-containing protein n=1 Tax=Boletus edulis BED1 TaxID=1328754 RepID=A0AAD4BJP3_BOLED|nr:kinase-like domain-containing protein [Boletus edulis]KAF8432952.1 kinase-like domain-containing protein [Boletus edulis BED1]
MEPVDYPHDKLENREIFWRDRYHFFKKQGYLLRPRYHPKWQPSWRFHADPLLELFEDNIVQWKGALLDATEDTEGGKNVFIKRVDSRTHPHEIKIASRLGSAESHKDNRNHCVPILTAFSDDREPWYQYIVMPVLRPFNEPNFTSFWEVADFVNQTLEGLAYVHKQNVAHRDCAAENILMDGSNLYKDAWHPMNTWLTRDGRDNLCLNRKRSEAEIKYYFIDFGLSVQFVPGQRERLVTGDLGRIRAPEQISGSPYDPFKLDVYYLGHVYQTKIVDEFKGLEVLGDLARLMTQPNPKDRPSADETQIIWNSLQSLPSIPPRWARLRPTREEGSIERIMNNALDVVGMVRGSMGF